MSENITEIGLISIISILSGLFIVLMKLIMRSKCSEFNCCFGLFKVIRDVDAEKSIENNKIDHNIKSEDNLYINDVLSNIKNNNIIQK